MAVTPARQTLHHLVDALPEAALADAERYLQALATDDPVLRAILLAPEDEEPETDEERQATAEAEADAGAGRVISHAEARRQLLGET
jgi:hypothetical protein